jgi:hypothetical protein
MAESSLFAALLENIALDADGFDDQPGFSPPILSEVATRAHLTLLDGIKAARDTLDRMLWQVASEPHADAAFDEINSVFGEKLTAAGAALLRFRDRRECEGEA